MNTLLIIIIFFLLLPILIIWFLAILEKKGKKQIKKDLKKAIGQLTRQNELQVVKIHFFYRKAIAIDRENKKLIFVNHLKECIDQFCIDLKTVAFCRLVKIKDEYSNDVEKVFIEVRNKGTNEISKLIFYDISFDNRRARATLIKEAEYWKNKIEILRRAMNSNYAFEFVL